MRSAQQTGLSHVITHGRSRHPNIHPQLTVFIVTRGWLHYEKLLDPRNHTDFLDSPANIDRTVREVSDPPAEKHHARIRPRPLLHPMRRGPRL